MLPARYDDDDDYYYSLIRVFHWSLSDSKSPQVSRTLLCILAVLNNVVVWMVSIIIIFICTLQTARRFMALILTMFWPL